MQKNETTTIGTRTGEVRIVNQRQAFLYVKNGLQPLRLEGGYGDKLVYVFPRQQSEGLFKKWREHELK